MRLEVKNIGNITGASLILNGITVVGGENGSGKSTIVFCSFRYRG